METAFKQANYEGGVVSGIQISMIERANSQPDFSPSRLWRMHRHALGAKITAYYAAEQLQPIYGDGYMLNQKMIDGFEERAREVGQKRVDAIGKMAKAAGVPFASVVTKATTAYEGIIDARKNRSVM